MKRVRYLTGAVGLAPMAFGMAVAPVAAHAATMAPNASTAPNAATGHAKTVSLHHVRAPGVATAAAVSSSSAGVANGRTTSSARVSPAGATVTGCKGTKRKNAFTNGHSLWFWYAHNNADSAVCIGTVEDNEALVTGTGHLFRVRIWSSNIFTHAKRQVYSHLNNGTIQRGGLSIVGTDGVHKYFGQRPNVTDVQVCGAWVKGSNHNDVEVKPLCTSVSVF